MKPGAREQELREQREAETKRQEKLLALRRQVASISTPVKPRPVDDDRNAETDRNASDRNAVTPRNAPETPSRNANAERQARFRKAQRAKREADRQKRAAS